MLGEAGARWTPHNKGHVNVQSITDQTTETGGGMICELYASMYLTGTTRQGTLKP